MPNEQITLFFSKFEMALNQLPIIVGNEVVNYSLEAFERQSWDGAAWKQRQSKKDTGRSILVKSTRLKRSVRIISSSPSSVIVGSDVPYAAIHNNGGTISRAPRSETFSRNRYLKGPKSKYFGGMGAFKKGITERTLTSAAIKGLTFKAYQINMPRRRYLGITPELKERIRLRVIEELKNNTR
jgi:phage gpG-like protein